MSEFYGWLIAQSDRRDLVGLIAKLVAVDPHFPRDVNQLHLILKYYDNPHRSDPIHASLFLSPTHRSLIKRAHKEWRRLPENQVINITMTYTGDCGL